MKVFNYSKLKHDMGGYIRIKAPNFFKLINKHKIGVKYLLAGSTATAVYLLILYVLTDIFGVWYLISAIIAFIVSLVASFFLQKFWTFRDFGLRYIKRQTIIYLILGAVNFILNPILLHIFVERFRIWYLLAAILVIMCLATVNYSINKFVTFKKNPVHENINV